jgi:hypothetical protein
MADLRFRKQSRARHWGDVIGMLDGALAESRVGEAALDSAELSLRNAANDPQVVRSIWLLFQIVVAAGSDDLGEDLRALDLDVSDAPSLIEILGAYIRSMDRDAIQKPARSRIGEMATAACVGAFIETTAMYPAASQGAASMDSRGTLRRLATPAEFGKLARVLFRRIIENCLRYHIGLEIDRLSESRDRFSSVQKQQRFNSSLNQYCQLTSYLVEPLAMEWFVKSSIGNRLSEAQVAGFIACAMNGAWLGIRQGLRVEREPRILGLLRRHSRRRRTL